MAIAYGAITPVAATTGTSLTYSSSAVSGSDTFGVVCYNGSNTGSDYVTGITWNSVAMTKIGSSVQVPGDRWMGVYYIIAPASGTTNITVTGSSSAIIRSFSTYYTGVDQTSPLDSSNTGTTGGLSSSLGVSTTVVASDCWTAYFTKDSTGSKTYTTSVGSMRRDTDAGGQAYSDSNGTVSTGSNTTTHTMTSGTSDLAGITFSFKPLSATSIKTVDGLVYASVKTVNNLAIASIKTINGLA